MAEEHNTERPGGAEFGQSVDEPDTTNDSREDDLMAVVVEPVPSRRITRKRLLATSVAAVMVLVAGLLSVRLLDDDGNRADGTSELETAGSNDDPDPTDETGPAADSDSSDSDDSSTTARVEGEAVASFSTATGELAWGGAGGNSPQWVLPWGDGFVALGVNYGSPALPEFSEEIQERFPEEIRDVVSAARGESDAITVADAQQALEEAGLMEEVLELLTENPDVMGLVSGPGPVGVTLATSSDGIDWVDLDASNLPVDATNFSAVASDGHPLVIVGQQWEPDMSRRSTNSLFTTDDLVTWQSHEFRSEP